MTWQMMLVAAIGGIGGAVVASGLNLLGHKWQRHARKREIVVSKAVDIALEQDRLFAQAMEGTDRPGIPGSDLIDVERIMAGLTALLEEGKLSPELRAKEEREMQGRLDIMRRLAKARRERGDTKFE